ncbi:hypothetical protein ACKKBG_A32400 [Auxenochlorella protothecoides x Auxenochlorella symbiontica]
MEKAVRLMQPITRSPAVHLCFRAARPAMGRALASLGTRRTFKVFSMAQEDEGAWMVVGLGNPGQKYHGTRHNIGFALVDSLAMSEGISMDKQQEKAAVGRGTLAGRSVMLVKPQTFMNRSGQSVGALARYYKVPLERVLVVADDLDTPLGALRLRAKGSNAGHNGMRSVQSSMGGSTAFPRLRLGIGRPAGGRDVADFVLQPFSRQEREVAEVGLAEAVDVVRAVLTLGLQKAISGVRVDAQGKQYAVQAPPKATGTKRKAGTGEAEAASSTPPEAVAQV